MARKLRGTKNGVSETEDPPAGFRDKVLARAVEDEVPKRLKKCVKLAVIFGQFSYDISFRPIYSELYMHNCLQQVGL